MAEPFNYPGAAVEESRELFQEEYELAYARGFAEGFLIGYPEGWKSSQKESLERIEKAAQKQEITLEQKEELTEIVNVPLDKEKMMESLVQCLLQRGVKENHILASTNLDAEQFGKIRQKLSKDSLPEECRK